VVGAGWIGCEVAASARQLGLDVTVVEPSSLPLERVLGAELGAVYRDIHLDHGVRMLLGTGVEAFEGAGAVERVRTSDGRTVDCDLVVVGVGVRPRTELAEQAGLAVGDGILVDEHLRTSAPDIFAAGDVAAAQHPFYGERVRVEHWANALHQPVVAARSMLGQQASYDRLPYFFTDQYDLGMEYFGLAEPGDYDETVVRGDVGALSFAAFWLRAGHVLAALHVNLWDDADALKALVRAQQKVVVTRLRDGAVPLAELLEGDHA
jgi:3-phenylpropionate/trans-cinnamate dioxygenase ferredoxin reductase subunit